MEGKTFSAAESAKILGVDVQNFFSLLSKLGMQPVSSMPSGDKFYSQEQLDVLKNLFMIFSERQSSTSELVAELDSERQFATQNFSDFSERQPKIAELTSELDSERQFATQNFSDFSERQPKIAELTSELDSERQFATQNLGTSANVNLRSNPVNTEKLRSTQDAAKYLGVSERTFRTWCTRENIQPVHIGDRGLKLYSPSQLDELKALILEKDSNGNLIGLPAISDGNKNQSPAVEQKVSEQTVKILKWMSAEDLRSKGVVDASPAERIPSKAKYFTCPFCGGEMTSRIGVGSANAQGFTEWHCRTCGGSFDNIDLLAKYYNLNRDADFFEICQTACKQFGRPFETETVDDTPPAEVNIPAMPMKKSPTVPSPKPDYSLQRDSLERAKIALKSIPPDQLGLQFLQPAKNGGYICPNPECRDGSGRDGTGMTHYTKADGTHEYYCGKCAHGYDNVAILGFYFGLDPNRQFREILQKAANYFDLPAIYDARGNISTVESKELTEEQKKRVHDEIVSSQKNLQSFVNSQGGKWRGLTVETLNKFMVGFNPHWYARKDAPRTPRIIIPTSFTHYLARLHGKLENFKIPDGVHLDEKEHRGHKEIFNFKRALLKSSDPIVFVVEGEIDTMSIYQASEGKINVISIGGSALATNLERQLQTLTAQKNFVVMLDNDKTGIEKAPILAAKLKALGHNAIVRFLSDIYNDANDFLQADANGLAERLRALYDDVKAAFDTLPVQPKINAPAPPTGLIQPTQPTDDFTVKLNHWQDNNGNVDPDIIPKIRDAKDYLDAFTPDNFKPADAQNTKTKHALALCQFYDCFAESALHYYAIVATAQENARRQIRLLKSKGEDLNTPEHAELVAITQINLGTLKDAIKTIVTDYKKAHKTFAQAERSRILREKREQRDAELEAQKAYASERIAELQKLPPSPERNAAIVVAVRELCEWKRDKMGNLICVKTTQANADLIFQNDANICRLIGFDEFQQVDVFLKKAPWENASPVGAEFSDRDELELRTYLRRNYTEFYSKELVQQCVVSYSNENSFHVIKDFFKNLPPWDGVERAETIFIKFLRVDDSAYSREVTLKMLLAAVARIFHPGCDFQLAPILLGKQGIGKSLILSLLGGQWYGALLDDAGDAHAIDAIQKLWFVEIKEMASMKKDVDANKRFIDNPSDTRRPAYGRRAITVPRHCIFFITTNNEQCLTDMTGNRRYPILQCNSELGDYVRDIPLDELIKNYIPQVWAEVYHIYNELFKDGFDATKLNLSDEAKARVNAIAEEHLRDDGMTGEIQAFLNTKIPPPPIWDLLTKDERRSFFINGSITIEDGCSDLNFRIRARHKYKAQDLVNDLDRLINYNFEQSGIRKKKVQLADKKFSTAYDSKERLDLIIYGTCYREHICAAEIFNECFGNDRRKTMARISEILNSLDDWTKGKRIAKDPVYGGQTRVFYRVEQQTDNEQFKSTDPQPPTPPKVNPWSTYNDDEEELSPIDPDDIPFDV